MYYGLSGTQYNLGAAPLKSGGEGSIFAVQGRSDCLAKIYHAYILNAELEEKLCTMYQNPPSPDVLAQIAWPIDVLYDSSRAFAGFLMNKLSVTHDLDRIYKYPATELAGVTLRHKLIIAQNICYVIAGVHKAGYVFGDFNPMNIGVNINDGTVAFFDADTYHFRDLQSGKTHRCRAGCPGYVAPELLATCKKFQAANPNAKETYANAPLPTFTRETDNFALAIHIFKLIMNGFTPYNGIPETSPVSQASPGQGDSAVARNSYCFAPGKKTMAVAMPEFSSLPIYIQDMFTRTFEKGYSFPSLRPSAEEWMAPLAQFEQELAQCNKNKNHFYYNKLSGCPYCVADSRYEAEMRKMTTPSGGGQKKFSSAPVITRPVVPPPGGSTSVHPTSSSNTRTTTYNTSKTNAGATSRSGSSMSTGLKVMIGVILVVIAFIFINVMSHIDRDTISIINGDFTISVGQTAEVRIRSSASRLTANSNSCIDTEWNNGKSSGGTYYLNVTGTSVGTCTLTIRKTDNEKIYDTITIRVIPAENGGAAAGDSGGIVDANGDDVVVVQPIDRKHDTKETAMSITVNTSTTDSIDSSGDEAWYVFSLNAPGYISITFEHESANTTNYLWDLYLYRDDGSTFYDGGSRYWSVDGEKGLTTCNVGLPAGTYYFRVDAFSSSNWSSKNYSFTINYEESGTWETETNNTKYDADPVSVNSTYYGSISSSGDEDWYTFTLDAAGYINVAFEHDPVNTTNYLWDLYLYRDDGSTFYDGGSRYWSVDGEKGLTTCNVGLPAGTYYFRVDAFSSSNWSSKNYSYVINYEISDSWEKEINNSKYNANPIVVNSTYHGSISSSGDEDWYTFTLASNSNISIVFNHDVADTTNYLWDIYLYRDDGATRAGDKDYWPATGDSAKQITNVSLPAGVYFIRIDAYSSSNWSSRNYSIVIG